VTEWTAIIWTTTVFNATVLQQTFLMATKLFKDNHNVVYYQFNKS
jgi:hypothetical protein